MIVSVQQAAALLHSGEVVAVPTETVYGLAASIRHPEGVAKIFSLKNRPQDNPLIVHLAASDDLHKYTTQLPRGATELAKKFWPGPLTLVLEANTVAIDAAIRANLPTAAFRVPQHPKALALLTLTGPLVMPSANLSGSPSATSPTHVAADFGEDLPILDGGTCSQGVESTILAFREERWHIARLGAIPPEAFQQILGYKPELFTTQNKPICPGQMYRHYAPRATLLLSDQIPPGTKGVVIGFSDRLYPPECNVIPLGNSKKPEEAAARLYQVLRDLDCNDVQEAVVDFDMPDTGLWLTIKERLKKAAS